MRYNNCHLQIFSLILVLGSLLSCNGQKKANPIVRNTNKSTPSFLPEVQMDNKISEYIRNIYEDRYGGLWFGTNGDGVAHYDGYNLSYYSSVNGFIGHQITGITEDSNQNIWFATDKGIIQYKWSEDEEGQRRFINHQDYLLFGKEQFWSIYADSKGQIWAGSASDIFLYDGAHWSAFELPLPEDISGTFITKATTWSISEDEDGHMWFSTNGFGAYEYDGKSFTRYTTADGLTDDSVDNIMQDRNGNIWLGTRYGGASRFDGKKFVNYTSSDSIGNNEVCAIYEDKSGHIWMSAEGFGVYRYDGRSFTNYGEKQGLKVKAVQTIFEDRNNRLWVGGGGGLYRFDGVSFIHITKDGPWK